jgi:hypothetical protein
MPQDFEEGSSVNKCVRVAVATLTIAIVAVGSTGRGVVGAAPKNGYEVWLVDSIQ